MNLNEFEDLDDYMNILNNLCIYIVYFYSIILILDELYNIGIFTFNYTYNYNYGTATEKFNGINTIEYETNRFKTYNNINFLKSDIFNNTYFNYIITVFITLITIISCISYGIFFYFKIIHNNLNCKFDISDELLSLPKQILSCICDDCHKLLPNCTFNYIILLIIIFIIPIAYILKLFFKIDYTPTNNSILFIMLIVLFSYIYNIYINNDNKDTIIIVREILLFISFTIIFLISIIIHNNIYETYNNSSLNSNLKDDYVMCDIYKQAPPNKPSPISLPIFNGENLLTTFNHIDGGNTSDVNYNDKKKLLEKYYNDKKDYDKSIIEYNIKNDLYNSTMTKQKLKLDDKTYFFNIMFNMFGINNKLNIFIIVLIIILLALYYYFNDDLFLSGMIYLLNILIIITLINAITYYNTYLNKYIIYEPLSYYKNDITVANTKLNMYFNSGNGYNFYHILNNNTNINANTNDDNNLNKNNIINDIKLLTNISNFNIDNINLIVKNITNYNLLNTNANNNVNDELDSIIYYKNTSQTPIEYLFSKISNIYVINKSNQISDFKEINKFKLNFSSISYEIFINFSYYYPKIYYKLYYYNLIILRLFKSGYNFNKIELTKLYEDVEKILINLYQYRGNVYKTDKTLISYSEIETIKSTIKTYVDNISKLNLDNNTYYETLKTNIYELLFNYDTSTSTSISNYQDIIFNSIMQ